MKVRFLPPQFCSEKNWEIKKLAQESWVMF